MRPIGPAKSALNNQTMCNALIGTMRRWFEGQPSSDTADATAFLTHGEVWSERFVGFLGVDD